MKCQETRKKSLNFLALAKRSTRKWKKFINQLSTKKKGQKGNSNTSIWWKVSFKRRASMTEIGCALTSRPSSPIHSNIIFRHSWRNLRILQMKSRKRKSPLTKKQIKLRHLPKEDYRHQKLKRRMPLFSLEKRMINLTNQNKSI